MAKQTHISLTLTEYQTRLPNPKKPVMQKKLRRRRQLFAEQVCVHPLIHLHPPTYTHNPLHTHIQFPYPHPHPDSHPIPSHPNLNKPTHLRRSSCSRNGKGSWAACSLPPAPPFPPPASEGVPLPPGTLAIPPSCGSCVCVCVCVVLFY